MSMHIFLFLFLNLFSVFSNLYKSFVACCATIPFGSPFVVLCGSPDPMLAYEYVWHGNEHWIRCNSSISLSNNPFTIFSIVFLFMYLISPCQKCMYSLSICTCRCSSFAGLISMSIALQSSPLYSFSMYFVKGAVPQHISIHIIFLAPSFARVLCTLFCFSFSWSCISFRFFSSAFFSLFPVFGLVCLFSFCFCSCIFSSIDFLFLSFSV